MRVVYRFNQPGDNRPGYPAHGATAGPKGPRVRPANQNNPKRRVAVPVSPGMSSSQWDRLRSDLEAATMRCEWAVAEVKRNGTTPALANLLEESRKECRELGIR